MGVDQLAADLVGGRRPVQDAQQQPELSMLVENVAVGVERDQLIGDGERLFVVRVVDLLAHLLPQIVDLLVRSSIPAVLDDRVQRPVEVALGVRGVADPFDLPFLADDECGGNGLHARRDHVVLFHRLVGIGRQRIADLVGPELFVPVGLAEEPRNGLQLLIADTDEGHAVVAELFLELADVGHAGPAGAAPGGPELQHVHLAGLELIDLVTLQPVTDIDGGRRRADGQGFSFVVSGPTQGCGPQGDRGGDGECAAHACSPWLFV